MKINEFLNKVEISTSKFPNTLKAISYIAAIVTIFAIADGYIQKSIHKQITDKEYIGKISKSLRPYLLLNLNGNVVYDHGAYDFIDFIDIIPDTINLENKKPFGIYISFKKPMPNKPIIENLTPHDLIYESTRAGNTGWVFRFKSDEYYGKFPNSESIIRIEIIF